jgi:hypothetical protein
MGIGKFLLFAREFDLLPHVVTKQSLVAIYRAANLSPEHSDEGLNYSEFTESLGRIALHWYSRQNVPSDEGERLTDKVLTLLGVMDESEGMITVLEQVGRTHSRAYSLQLSDSSTSAWNEAMELEVMGADDRSQTPMSARVGASMSTSQWGESMSMGRPLSSRSLSESRSQSMSLGPQNSFRFTGSQTDRDSAASVRFTSTMKPSMGAKQGSSMFKSKTKRGDSFLPKEVTPAPGLYDPHKVHRAPIPSSCIHVAFPQSKWGKAKVSGATTTAASFPTRKAQNTKAYIASRLEPRRVTRR